MPYYLVLHALRLSLPSDRYILHGGAVLLALEFLVAVRFMADEFWPVIRRHSMHHHHHHLLLLLLLSRMRTRLHAPI